MMRGIQFIHRTREFLALVLCSAAVVSIPVRAETSRDTMPQVFTMSPMGVNLQSGIFVQTETEFTIGGLSFIRSWRAIPTFAPSPGGIAVFGGWDHNFLLGAQWHPTAHPGRGMNVYADGKIYQFTLSQDGTYWTPWNLDQHNNSAMGAQLTGTSGSNLVFRNQAGDVHTMNADNQTTSIVYADGTRTEIIYDGSKRPHVIMNNRGDAIILDYNGNGRLATACAFNRAEFHIAGGSSCGASTLRVDYGYSTTSAAQGWVLSSVTGADGQVTSMQYDTYYRPNLTCVTLPNSSTCRITNAYGAQSGDLEPLLTRPDQVRVQTTATGEVWRYSYLNADLYQDWPPLQWNEVRQTEAEMTDPLNRVTRVVYENGFVRHLYAPEGHTEYQWASLNPSVFIQPAGNRQIMGYDLRNNLVTRTWRAPTGSSEADIVRLTVYPGSYPDFTTTGCEPQNFRTCNKPIYSLDENGNRTDYTHDPAHGGVLTLTRPAPSSGAARPQIRYAYAQIYAGVRDSGGALVNADTPVWMLAQESQCRTQASCSGTSDEILTTYEYGSSGSANALRLRGVVVSGNGITSRTCYGYDSLGNRISETGPGAQLSSCP